MYQYLLTQSIYYLVIDSSCPNTFSQCHFPPQTSEPTYILCNHSDDIKETAFIIVAANSPMCCPFDQEYQSPLYPSPQALISLTQWDRSVGQDLYRFGVTGHTVLQHEQHPISRQSDAWIVGNLHRVRVARTITLGDKSQLDASHIVVQRVSRDAVS